MESPIELFGMGYNSKSKIYPDGTMVSTYCNEYCFHIPDIKPKKHKEDSALIDFTKLSFFEINRIFENHNIYYSHEIHEYYYSYESFSFNISADSLYSDFLSWNSLDKWFNNQSFEEDKKDKKKRADSVKRSRDRIYDIVMCNEWDYFFTGTLGNTPFDPTSAKEALKPLQNWLSNSVKRFGLKYILVAELQPISKRIHFHGFINNALEVVDSGTKLYKGIKKPIKDKTAVKRGFSPSDGRTVYNMPSWKFGYTTAIETYNGSNGCAQYIMKYVTKDCKDIFGRYYWSSRNLLRSPDLYFENVDYNNLLLPSYYIPKCKRQLKYYTFFPGQTDFHFVDDPKPERYDNPEAVLVSYIPPALASANSSAILSDLEAFEAMHDFSLSDDFVEV